MRAEAMEVKDNYQPPVIDKDDATKASDSPVSRRFTAAASYP